MCAIRREMLMSFATRYEDSRDWPQPATPRSCTCSSRPPTVRKIFWRAVIASRDLFLAKAHAHKYKGYADAQLRRMMGDRGRGKHGQRPELEQQYGFDVKAAMHVLRLLHEGIEFVSQRLGDATSSRTRTEQVGRSQARRMVAGPGCRRSQSSVCGSRRCRGKLTLARVRGSRRRRQTGDPNLS